MRCLTVTQPWASLIACGAKRIETRSWKTPYRGPLAIHAAKGFPQWARDFANSVQIRSLLGWDYEAGASIDWRLPLGSVIAVCRLDSILDTNRLRRTILTEQEEMLGDYSEGRYGWLLTDVQPLAEPVPAKGALSLWDWAPAKEERTTKP